MRLFDNRLAVGLLTTTLALGMGGCSSRVKTYPVRGKVVYQEDGSPVRGGVTIWCESTTPPYTRASGPVDGEGNFVLSTVQKDSGAVKGEQRIRFAPSIPFHESDAATALAKVMHPRYLEYQTAGIRRTVSPGENTLVIEVEKAPARR